MKTKYDRVWAEINLDVIDSNMRAMQAVMADGAKIAGVVKADAYGHGAVAVAKTIEPFVYMYAVATVEEGIELRKHQIKKPILILGVTPENQYEELVQYELDTAMFEWKRAKKLSETAIHQGKKAGIHLAVDTGMSRIGFEPTEKAVEEVLEIALLSGIEIHGMFTHFARADERQKESTKIQYQAFFKFSQMLQNRGVTIPILHCSNSAALLELQDMHMDMARAGISIYGLYPSDEMRRDLVKLCPAMEWKARISYVKTLEAGRAISYGGTFVAKETMRVATIPVGYADGYPRSASGRAEVLICGMRAPILGRVCMDQFMVDVTQIEGAEEGCEVTLVGRDQKEQISMEELAERSDGFHYELCCGIGKRVPRVYLRNGEVVGYQDYFDDNRVNGL